MSSITLEGPQPASDASDRPVLSNLLSVEQSADLLQVSVSSLRNYIREGKLKAFRVAGKRKMLVDRSDLFALLEPLGPAL